MKEGREGINVEKGSEVEGESKAFKEGCWSCPSPLLQATAH